MGQRVDGFVPGIAQWIQYGSWELSKNPNYEGQRRQLIVAPPKFNIAPENGPSQ